jgi:competence protein ComEA
MKRLINAYTSFTRTERMGILALFIIIGILITVRFTLHLWVHPQTNPAEQEKLTAAWNEFKSREPQTPEGAFAETEENTTENNNSQQLATTGNNSQQKTTIHNTALPSGSGEGLGGKVFPFDPNTIDSAGLRQLGLKEKTTSIFLNWRRKGKRFYRKEELKKLYTLSAEEYKRLEPYIVINTLNARNYNPDDEYGPLPAVININKADSITFIRLRGIGPAITHRILEKRRQLGGFSSVDQLLAVHRFSDSVTQYLKQKLAVE